MIITIEPIWTTTDTICLFIFIVIGIVAGIACVLGGYVVYKDHKAFKNFQNHSGGKHYREYKNGR